MVQPACFAVSFKNCLAFLSQLVLTSMQTLYDWVPIPIFKTLMILKISVIPSVLTTGAMPKTFCLRKIAKWQGTTFLWVMNFFLYFLKDSKSRSRKKIRFFKEKIYSGLSLHSFTANSMCINTFKLRLNGLL